MKVILFGGVALLAMAPISSAWAQNSGGAAPAQPAAQAPTPPPSAGSSADPQTVVVTALRVQTNIQKTPLAVSAISSSQLRDAGIVDARDLAALVPNFAFTQDSYDARISIRGVTSTNVTDFGDPSVAFLMDGIYIARPADMMSSFYDLNRVEVLRGPQGTLYGRNTTAGVVNVISAPPRHDYEESIDVRAGNLDMYGATGMVNVPVGEDLGLRIAMNYQRQDSNIIEGVPSKYSPNPGTDQFSTRVSFGGAVNDRFNFVVRADVTHSGGTENDFVDTTNAFIMTNKPGVTPIYINQSGDALRTLHYAPVVPSQRNDLDMGIMTEMTYHFGLFDLTYLGGYRATVRDDLRNFRLNNSYNNKVTYNGQFNDWSHELRASFGQGTRFSGQFGLYYFQEHIHLDYNLFPPFATSVGGPNAVGYAETSDPDHSESEAAFGQLTYEIIDNLHLTGGLRYTRDTKSTDGGNYIELNNPLTGVVSNVLSSANVADRTWSDTTWKTGLDYDINNLGLVYASVSTGYKAGGFNTGCQAGTGATCSLTANTLYYQPETITSYEGGYKFAFFDRRLRWNLSVFHYDYSNLQLSTFAFTAKGGPTRLTQNAGAAKVDGVENDFSFTPWTNGKFEVTPAFTDARYTSFVPKIASGYSRSFNGLPLDHAPKWSGSVAYEHTIPLANGGRLVGKVLSNISSPYYIADLALLVQYKNPSYTKTDLTLTYNAPHNKWYVEAFAKNLEDTITLSNVGSGLIANATLGEPRTFGVRAGAKY
jgi:iron complex outermembrane recepter protein